MAQQNLGYFKANLLQFITRFLTNFECSLQETRNPKISILLLCAIIRATMFNHNFFARNNDNNNDNDDLRIAGRSFCG
jgi:hypothetical protein